MKTFLARFDWLMLAVMLALVSAGTVAIWSAGSARAETVFHGMWVNNLVTAAVGLTLYFAIAAVDYRRTLDFLALPGYVVAIACLVAVLVFGTSVYGGRRWLWFFQPSEISKLFVISLVAWLFGRRRIPLLNIQVAGFRAFLLLAVAVGIPVALILAEPDLALKAGIVICDAVIILSGQALLGDPGRRDAVASSGIDVHEHDLDIIRHFGFNALFQYPAFDGYVIFAVVGRLLNALEFEINALTL